MGPGNRGCHEPAPAHKGSICICLCRFAGLWTEVCVAFPTLDALRAGYEVFFVTDAIGGVSTAAHEAAVQRMIQAGGTPISVLGLACELQRDWGRPGAERLRAAMREYFAARRVRGS